MTLRDRGDAFTDALSAGDFAGIRLLERDRDEAGPGVSKSQLEQATGMRHLGGFFHRLHVRGYSVGETASGLVWLGHDEPAREAA